MLISCHASIITDTIGEHDSPIGTPQTCCSTSSPTVMKVLPRMNRRSPMISLAVK